MADEIDKTMSVDPQSSEASDNDAIFPEDMKPNTSDIMIDVEPPTSEASESDLYARKMEYGIVNDEESEQLEESYDSSFKEEGESSRGKSDTTDDIITSQPRKKPTLVVVGSNHKFNVKSRYLSDSVSSCHDFCKFGHKHESEKSEKKTRRLTLGTIKESKPLNETISDDPQKFVPEKLTKKKEFDRRLSLLGIVPEKARPMHLEGKNHPEDITRSKMKRVESERKPLSIQSPQTSSRTKTTTQAVKKIATKSPNLEKTSTQKLKKVKTRKDEGSNSKGEMEVKINEKERVCSSPTTSVNEEGGDSEDIVNEVKEKESISESPKSTLRSGDIKGVKEIKAKKSMSNSPKTPLKRSSSLKARLYKNNGSSLNSRNYTSPGGPKVFGDDDRIETNPDMKEVEKTSKGTVSGENSQKSLREVQAKKPDVFKGNAKGNGASLLTFSSRESTKARGEKSGSDVTKTKKGGFKTEESGSKTSIPREKPKTRRLKSSDYKNTKNDMIRDENRSKTSTPREKLSVEQNLKPKRKEKSNVEEKDVSAWKVKFKRGTVVALQVANNAPKRLRFRRARTLGDNQITKAEIDLKSRNECVMGDEDKVGPEKVRLRHQETSEKKDDVDLNNVIEETASKLVKTRKSKVKALVGAFETVMSLGDRKRLVETGAS